MIIKVKVRGRILELRSRQIFKYELHTAYLINIHVTLNILFLIQLLSLSLFELARNFASVLPLI